MKKSWHPSTLRNIERVWKAERMRDQEKAKIEQLQKELQEERNKQEMRQYAENKGVVKKRQERLDWMYQGVAGFVDREQYLLGRKVDKNFEILKKEEDGVEEKDEDQQPGAIFNMQTTNAAVDLDNKIREDPLFAIKKQEMKTKKTLLSNPIKMKHLRDMIEKSIKNSRKSQKKKKHKKKKTRDSSSSSSSDSDSSSKHTKRKQPHVEHNAEAKLQKRKSTNGENQKDEVGSYRNHGRYSHSSSDGQYENRDGKTVRYHDSYRSREDNRKASSEHRHSHNYTRHKSAKTHSKGHKRQDSSSDAGSIRGGAPPLKRLVKSNTPSRSPKPAKRRHDSSSSSEENEVPSREAAQHSSGEESRPEQDSSEAAHHWGERHARQSSSEDAQPKFGLIVRGSHKKERHMAPARNQPAKQELPKVHSTHKRRPLSEQEKEEARRQMMENAQWRDEQRKSIVTRYRETEKAEEKNQDKRTGQGFIRPLLAKATDSGSVENRIKQKMYTVQRSSGAMDVHFARK